MAARHAHAAVDAAASTNSAVADAGQAAQMSTPALQWSMSEAWTWLGHAWISAIHVPYLGLAALVLGFAIVLRALMKVVR